MSSTRKAEFTASMHAAHPCDAKPYPSLPPPAWGLLRDGTGQDGSVGLCRPA